MPKAEMVGDALRRPWRSELQEISPEKGRSFQIARISALILLLFFVAVSPAAALMRYELEGYTLEPQESWTTGAVEGWSDGTCVSFRYTVENTGPYPKLLDLRLRFEHNRGGVIGIRGFEAFNVPDGYISGPYFDGYENGYYRWTVIVPGRASYVLKWCARLDKEARLWPEAYIYVSAGKGEVGAYPRPADQTVPIAIRNIKMPDLYVINTADARCGEIRYSINYGNAGETEQKGTVLVGDYDETRVAVTNAGGGTDDGNAIAWEIRTLAAGERGRVSYTVRIKEDVPGGAKIASGGFISGDLAEKVTANNYYVITSDARVRPAADAGFDKTIAVGDSVMIGGDLAAVGGRNYTYIWSPVDYLDDPAKPNPTATPVGTITYRLSVTNEDGCSNSDYMTITVAVPPACGIGGPEGVCEDRPLATFYYGGDEMEISDLGFRWQVDGEELGDGEAIDIDWSPFGFGMHQLILAVMKTYPDGTVTSSRCEHTVRYIESPDSSIRKVDR